VKEKPMKEKTLCFLFWPHFTAETMKNIRNRSAMYVAKFSHKVVMILHLRVALKLKKS